MGSSFFHPHPTPILNFLAYKERGGRKKRSCQPAVCQDPVPSPSPSSPSSSPGSDGSDSGFWVSLGSSSGFGPGPQLFRVLSWVFWSSLFSSGSFGSLSLLYATSRFNPSPLSFVFPLVLCFCCFYAYVVLYSLFVCDNVNLSLPQVYSFNFLILFHLGLKSSNFIYLTLTLFYILFICNVKKCNLFNI